MSEHRRVADNSHWTGLTKRATMHNMDQDASSSTKPILSWLGLGILLLALLALVLFSQGSEPPSEPARSTIFSPIVESTLFPTAIGSPSPLSAALNSPVLANVTPIKPEQILQPVPAPPDSALPPATDPGPALPTTSEDDFHLTVLHTNDTWGYLLPCG